MTDALVQKIESPWARAMRTFLSALSSSPVVVGVFGSLTSIDDLEKNWVSVALVVITSALTALSALALGYSEEWRARTETPIAKGIAQALQYFALGVATVTVADLTMESAVNLGDSIVALIVASIVSGILTLGLNAAQKPPTEPVRA